MKKLIALILTTAVVFTGCSSNTGTADDKLKETSSVTVGENTDNTESKATNTDLSTEKGTESVDDVESDTEDIEITIPALYMEGTTQEQLDQDYSTYATATINADGSVTFVMSKAMHAAFVEVIGSELTNELNSLPGSSEFPNVTSIEINDDFTEFNLKTTSIELSEEESMSALYVYIFGKMYNFFNQTETSAVTVNFVNADSGEVIYTSDSAQMDALIDAVK